MNALDFSLLLVDVMTIVEENRIGIR
jgi:hypothetical protein